MTFAREKFNMLAKGIFIKDSFYNTKIIIEECKNTKVAEVDTNEICPIGGSCYTDVDYTLSEETDSTMGIKFVNNFRENMSFSVDLDNNDSSGSTASLGIRFRL